MRGKSAVTVVLSLATIVLAAIAAPPALAEAPEFGRCLPAEGKTGGYKNASCTVATASRDGRFEWSPGAAKTGFTTTSKPGSKIVFEGVKEVQVECTGETSSGEYTSPKLEEHVVFRFTGCKTGSTPVTSPGAPTGEVVTNPTECELGVLKKGAQPRDDQLGLTCAEEESFMWMRWAGGYFGGEVEWCLRGWWFFTLTSNRMKAVTRLYSQQSHGVQVWEKFVEGPPEPLEATFNGGATWERAALGLRSVQTNEEPVEANSVA